MPYDPHFMDMSMGMGAGRKRMKSKRSELIRNAVMRRFTTPSMIALPTIPNLGGDPLVRKRRRRPGGLV